MYHQKTFFTEAELSGLYSPQRMKLILADPTTLTPGQRIRRERYLHGLSLEKMALTLGISPSYLGSLERGLRPLSAKIYELLRINFGLSRDYVAEGVTISVNDLVQLVRETPQYTPAKNLASLIAVCTPEEEAECYNLVYTYLSQRRTLTDTYFWSLPKK